VKGERRTRTLVLALAPFRDAALLVGPLAARRRRRSGEHVTVAGPAGLCDILGTLRLADEVWEIDPPRPSASGVVGLYRSVALLAKARSGRFDDVVDLFPSARSVLSAWLGAGTKAAPGTARFVDSLIKRRAGGGAPPASPLARTAGMLGVAPDDAGPELRSEPDADAWIERALGATGYRGGVPVVAVHTADVWPSERFVEVATRLRAALGAWLVVVDTPREPGPATALGGALGGSVLALGAPSGSRFVAVVERASLVLTDLEAVAALATFGHVPALDVTGLDAESAYDRACTLVGRTRTGSLFKR
jgi:hypothetical protein